MSPWGLSPLCSGCKQRSAAMELWLTTPDCDKCNELYKAGWNGNKEKIKELLEDKPMFKAEPLVKPSDTLELLKGIRKRISEAAIESRKWYGDETMPAFAYWKAIRTALKEIDIEIEKREHYE